MLRFIRKTLFAFGCALFGVLVSLVSDAPKSNPDGLWRGVEDLGSKAHPLLGAFLASAGEGLFTAIHWAVGHPVAVGIIAAIVFVPAFIAFVASLIPRRIVKDPQRLYTADQRRAGSDRSGGRCEMEGIFFTRCRRPGEHGDHWFPHSKGGATSMNNFVWACARCNTSKGARIPTFWETTRLEWRRRRYFDPSIPARPSGRVPVG